MSRGRVDDWTSELHARVAGVGVLAGLLVGYCKTTEFTTCGTSEERNRT